MANFQYVIAIDFEATCEEIQPRTKFRKSEIIDFPAVLMNLKTKHIEAEFREFIRPVEKPLLSDFCKNLTGIMQDDVNQGILLQEALLKFDKWLKEVRLQYNLILPKTRQANLSGEYNCAFVCWSDCDLQVFLAKECTRKSIQKSPYFNQWIDLKKIFSKYYGNKSFKDALKRVGLAFEGRQHSGIDDARMTAKLVLKLIQCGKKIELTSDMTPNVRQIDI